MQRYFINESYENQSEFSITGENYHHIVRVMRMKPEDQLFLAFTNKVVIQGEITAVTEEKVLVRELSKEESDKELPIHVTIACGLPKGDKLEWIVQKGTELGGHRFIGFPAKNSIVKWDHKKRGNKAKRLGKIAQEAAEQSHRQLMPEVLLLEKEQELIDSFSNYDKVLIAYEESAKQGERSVLADSLSKMKHGESLLILFGPEGGFSPDEIEAFNEQGGVSCGLGPRILRAETAPLYALSAISYQLEMLL
ncbi:16S rRNA (uracil(1498)-N(3))-methyltransferase [Enterococcus sp. BWR-S5]|uniref:16S rRNA (uracil(1498)-N(3))-methyltransferase n=1 Tax=Enterococcus sp. BWR-S5 TaxID=2787714 RepID=UPI001924DD70|nr:16S rRNA (uracil(1498)-N(3))-methyltransferase [Enterococcus sp. BWR-S5]MBL1223975.1 16S rRNA (uracil(1498)-N(3))-methyltransferase [Enterococcus sp. BWR-S5]